MIPSALYNGEPAETLPVTDRGLHYGDGVFRTVRVAGGRPVAWTAQLARLAADCRQLDLPAPDADTLAAENGRLFADGGDGMLKIVITRGGGGRGYAPPERVMATRLLLRYPPPAYPAAHAEKGVAGGYCDTPLPVSPALAGAKHLNRLEHVLARRECVVNSWAEGLMRTPDGRVICGTMSNLFAVMDEELVTPAITDAGVRGATRDRILAACAAAGRACRETTLTAADLQDAEELFVCNSAMEIWSLRSLAGRAYPHGPVARWCRRQLAASA